MPQDKYKSVWVSNSSMNDFQQCKRLYYLRNMYKDPKTGKKINLINPALSLGQAVHEVLEALATLPAEERTKQPLLEIYDQVWEKFSGKKGGFPSIPEEKEYKERGKAMLQRVLDNPGPIANKALRLPAGHNNMPPNYYLSTDHNIILCGRIDWLEYVPETNSVHVIDFKTGNNEEKDDSMQLPIYCLLVKNCQKRNIHKVSYWYLGKDDGIKERTLPDTGTAAEKILTVALDMKQARLAGPDAFTCRPNGCRNCLPFEAILKGEAELVNSVGYQDIYIN
jgi:ATP-dependent helicase/DNAse subunit B